MTNEKLYAASLFSGAGIGDLGLRAAGFSYLCMLEKEADRAALSALNFPEAAVITGDIWERIDQYCAQVESALHRCGASELFLLSCTAPCQGMSKSGQGTLLRNIREGKRPKLDLRNRLILPALDVINRLRPRWIIFENVLEMGSTLIEDNRGEVKKILSIIAERLGSDYVGKPYEVEFANYGVPQRRQRLITVYTRDELGKAHFEYGHELIPPSTHSASGRGGKTSWVSVEQALEGFPSLDAKDKRVASCMHVPFHRVPVLDAKKYEWVRHAAPGDSAFNSQCKSPECLFDGNATHRNARTNGINRASKDTPLYCEKCGELLPRPYTEDPAGRKRLMSGFTSAYKRMDGHLPSPALTRNLSYACSDNKIHPTENRVLSLAEAMALQTLSDFPYSWGPINIAGRDVRIATDALIRLVIGESVPPLVFRLLGQYMIQLSSINSSTTLASCTEPMQLNLI